MALGLACSAPMALAQTLPDDFILCGGHGMAMGAVADRLIEAEGPSENLQTMRQAGDLLFANMMWLYAGYTSCAVTRVAAEDEIMLNAGARLDAFEARLAEGTDPNALRGQMLQIWTTCIEIFGQDFMAGINALRESEDHPCGWES